MLYFNRILHLSIVVVAPEREVVQWGPHNLTGIDAEIQPLAIWIDQKYN